MLERHLSDDTHMRMKYRKQNEINGIATLVSKVLPAYYSGATNMENGCGVITGRGITYGH